MSELNVPLNISLHANQQAIHDSQALNIVVMAGKRFGKTKLACYKLVKWAGKRRRVDGVFAYIAPTYGQAKSIAWGEFKSLVPPILIKRVVENELLITLVNDSVIRLFGADNLDSLRGIKFYAVVKDEAAYIDKYAWNNIVRGQLLGALGEDSGHALFISSPLNPVKSIGKAKTDWYPEFYQEALRKKNSGDTSWDAFHFTVYDNPTLDRKQIDDIRADSTDDEWGVEYLANPSAHAGQVYSEFNYESHVKEVENSGILARGIDWGIAHPTVCLWVKADKEKKEIYVEDEYVKSGNTIEENVETILKMTGGRPVDWTVCDPSLNKRNSQTKRTDKEEFDRLGIYCLPGDNNDRGYNIVKMFLKKNCIRINPKCRILIKELKNLQWGQEEANDCSDTLRYICVRIHDTLFRWKDEPVKEEALFNNKVFNVRDFTPKKHNESRIVEEVRSY